MNYDTYISWLNMRRRIYSKNNPAYKNYGGRGITICKRWEDYENFLQDMGKRPKDKSLDRIDNNGNYCKENCRWATRKEQNNNNRRNVIIEYKGKKMNIAQWAEFAGIKRQVLYDRVCVLKWDFEQAITSNFKERRKCTFQTYKGRPIKQLSIKSIKC